VLELKLIPAPRPPLLDVMTQFSIRGEPPQTIPGPSLLVEHCVMRQSRIVAFENTAMPPPLICERQLTNSQLTMLGRALEKIATPPPWREALPSNTRTPMSAAVRGSFVWKMNPRSRSWQSMTQLDGPLSLRTVMLLP